MARYSSSVIKTVVNKIKRDSVQLIELQFTDYLGTIKSITIPTRDLVKSLTEGIWFDGSSVEGFARIQESDMFLLPDPNTYALIPWRSSPENGSVARFICDVHTPEAKPFEGDPRQILKRALAEAKNLGFTYMVGPEVEFFLFDRPEAGKLTPQSPGNGYYFTFSLDKTYEVKREMIATLENMGINVEASHYEVAGNQHEIDFRYADALTTADNTITFKYALKAVAHRHGMQATFMPKPIFGINGSGMHVHQSLFRGGRNAFYAKGDPYHLSRLAYRFLAGQLKYVREITGVISPTVNSYKRLTPGYEAPVYISWARKNRSALIRIPETRQGQGVSTRLELRCPDPSCNPYLAFAAMLKAGLTGLKNKLAHPDPVEEDVYHFTEEALDQRTIGSLPGSLEEAIKLMEQGTIVKQTLGEATFAKYLGTKTQEWDSYRTWVTDWEIDRYLEEA